jgi:hypothetical protein
MFAARSQRADRVLSDASKLGEDFIRQPDDPYRQYAIKWDGEWQVT